MNVAGIVAAAVGETNGNVTVGAVSRFLFASGLSVLPMAEIS